MSDYDAKTNWKYDDPVTEHDLNRIEKGIKDAHEKAGNLNELDTKEKTDLVAAINELKTQIGNLTNLETEEKASLVNSVNEIYNMVSTHLADYVKLFNLTPSVLKIPIGAPYRAWQGVAVHDDLIYVFTDRNENFELENIISVYSLDGKLVSEKRNAYTVLDSEGRFMSFGDGNIIDGFLFITAYNINSEGNPLTSRIVKFNIPDLSINAEYEIGGNVAESVTKHNNAFWVVYYDVAVVRKFDLNFNFLQEYQLEIQYAPHGYFQGSLWEGNYFYANLHGHNFNANTEAFSKLYKYFFNGTDFNLVEVIDPPTIGCGQGISKYGDYYFWNDRPNNTIVVTKSLIKSNIYSTTMPILRENTIEPELLNGFERWDSTRTARITLKDGIVYFTGMVKAPEGFVANGDPNNHVFFVPMHMLDRTNKNFICATNKGPIRVTVASYTDIENGRRVVLGNAGDHIEGLTWICFDNISYPILD